MKITKSNIRQMIKEELALLQKQAILEFGDTGAPTQMPNSANDPNATRLPDNPNASSDDSSRKLALVAQELQLLLNKIKAELQ